jgi:hypothetical protein
MFAVYKDPQLDEWPVYALETWIDAIRGERVGFLLDEELQYPISLGTVRRDEAGRFTIPDGQANNLRITGDPAPHGGRGVDGEPVCPVVRFVNAHDAEDVLVGEVQPLIKAQRAINAINFDRLIVSRFGAFPQRYAIGWAPGQEELVRTSMSRVWGIDMDPNDVKLGEFTAASVDGYNKLIEDQLRDVAMEAQIPLAAFGNMANLSADALAMAEAPHQRKLKLKRESFGESAEQLLRLGAQQAGLTEVSAEAEVVWRDTDARSFAQVVDGVQKLSAQGVPIDELLDLIPGMTQQKIDSIRNAMRRQSAQQVVETLAQAAQQARLRAVPNQLNSGLAG